MPRSEQHEYPALDMSMIKDEGDKRAKREIANMNERRRMQNINSGFHSLRALLPHKHDGEKLSKAAILQHTATYIYQLEQEITKLLSQNSELKRAIGNGTPMTAVNTNTPEWIKRFASEPPDCPSCKRRKYDDNNRHLDLSPLGAGDGGSSTESSSEQEVSTKYRARKHNGNKTGGGVGSAGDMTLRKQLTRVEKQLEEERRMRRMFEEELNYQTKSVHQNGRQYNNALDPTIVADEVEVASESIEIEMHSCPASPPDTMLTGMPTIEQVSPSAANMYLASQHSSGGISSQLDMSHKLLEQQQQQRAQKQNAIALPIDVPFVAPSEVETDNDENENKPVVATHANGQMVLLLNQGGQIVTVLDSSAMQTTSNVVTAASAPQIIHLVSSGDASSGTNSPTNLSAHHGSIITAANSAPIMSTQNVIDGSPESAKTSRQNLNTIVEAIRHLEGDHFLNEPSNKLAKESPRRQPKQEIPEMVQAYANQLSANKLNGASRLTNVSLADIVKQESDADPQIILHSLSSGAATQLTTISSAMSTTAGAFNTSTLSLTDSQPRPQIIQRPNVIVATSVEN